MKYKVQCFVQINIIHKFYYFICTKQPFELYMRERDSKISKFKQRTKTLHGV